jgi:CheY-like chemotaxis protein
MHHFEPTEKKSEHILYVEDDADSCELIQLWLGFHGYTVETVRTAAEALPLAQAGLFSLFILDNWLPDGDGIELCKQIRAFDGDTSIIFVSGVAYPADIGQAMSAGAQAYLTKPIELTNLYHAVQEFSKR